MNILITGIHGFVGSNLVVALCDEHTLYGLDLVTPSKMGVEHTYTWKDLEENKIPPIDIVIHLAGKAHDTQNTADPQSYFDINCGLTEKVFDLFRRSKAEKFIFFSSVKAVADSVDEDFLTEDTVPNPTTPYGQSKLQAEQYILAQALPEGKRVYILRPCMIHGQGNKGNLNLLYNVVAKGVPYPLGLYDNRRSFTSIQNLAYILMQFIEHPIASETYQISDDEPVSTNEIISLITDSLHHTPRIWNIPQGMIQTAARAGDLFGLPFNSERLKKLTESYVVSNAKLKSALGVSSLPISARNGLMETFKSFSK